jgi:hypothetical protein
MAVRLSRPMPLKPRLESLTTLMNFLSLVAILTTLAILFYYCY